MSWLWLALAFVIALANLAFAALYGVGTDAEQRPRTLEVLQAATYLSLVLALAEVWVHTSGAASWHSWPLMWLAPAATALQAPFRVLSGVSRWRSAPCVLAVAGVFAAPALLMVAAGKAPLDRSPGCGNRGPPSSPS